MRIDRPTIMQHAGHFMRRIGVLLLSVAILFLSTGFMGTAPAIATIRQLEEAPGQVVYQSRQTLIDPHGMSWQAIAFKRIRPDGSSQFYLRLVGFPGTGVIDRSQPLTLRSSLGQTLVAADASQQIFTDDRMPESNVGQYDLQPLLPDLQAELPWRLSLPMLDTVPLTLRVPPKLVQEWQTVANY